MLERHQLGDALLIKVNALQAQGLNVGTGTIVCATLIRVPYLARARLPR